jgi:hypothetical protein
MERQNEWKLHEEQNVLDTLRALWMLSYGSQSIVDNPGLFTNQ